MNERKLNAEDKELVRHAKGKEVKEGLSGQVVRRLVDGERVTKEEAMNMRFVLTWKTGPIQPTGKRAKPD